MMFKTPALPLVGAVATALVCVVLNRRRREDTAPTESAAQQEIASRLAALENQISELLAARTALPIVSPTTASPVDRSVLAAGTLSVDGQRMLTSTGAGEFTIFQVRTCTAVATFKIASWEPSDVHRILVAPRSDGWVIGGFQERKLSLSKCAAHVI